MKINKADFENFIKQKAFYGKGQLKASELPFQLCDLKLIGKGFFSRVYKINHLPWVIKEGRWDLDFKITKEIYLPMPARLMQIFMGPFNYHFQPTQNEIIKQYQDYLKLTEYFGFFKPGNYFHPMLDQLQKQQKKARESLIITYNQIASKYNFETRPQIEGVLKSDTLFTNFLPREFLLYGPSITPSQKNKNTSFIIQEYLKGEHLHDITLTEMSRQHKEKLILFLLLILKFNLDTKLLPDLRPRYLITQAYDWFYSTDNILLTPQNQVYYLDTRWLWPKSFRNPLRRGLIFPELILNSTKRWLYLISRDL